MRSKAYLFDLSTHPVVISITGTNLQVFFPYVYRAFLIFVESGRLNATPRRTRSSSGEKCQTIINPKRLAELTTVKVKPNRGYRILTPDHFDRGFETSRFPNHLDKISVLHYREWYIATGGLFCS